MTKHGKVRLAKAASGTMLGLGAASLLASIVYASSILAFIGLGLTFWGAILIYVQPEEHTRKVLLDASVIPSLETLDEMIRELGYRGKAIYLPPKYLKDPETSKAYVPKQRDGKLPASELILEQESRLFIKSPQGILLKPPGAELTKLLESTMGTRFTNVDLQYLTQNLPRIFVEDLEIAENLEIQTKFTKVSEETNDSAALPQIEDNTILVRITNTIYKDMCKEAGKLSNICSTIGCPICSAIACAIAKATGKPVIIQKIQPTEDGKTVEAIYRVLETIESQEQAEKAPAETSRAIAPHPSPRSTMASLSLTALGSIILAWVGYLTWYDLSVWDKDLTSIFFGSRTGEAISLGIDMKVIYYFLIGLALLLCGLIAFLRRKRRKL